MDKAITKRFMDAEGIRTAPWHDVRYTEADIPALVEKLETPCAVKIVNGGSSIGVELPDTKEAVSYTHLDVYKRQWSVRANRSSPAARTFCSRLSGVSVPSEYTECMCRSGF